MQNKTEDRLELEMFPKSLVIPTSKWYTMRKLMPWREIEEMLANLFADRGRNAIPVRHIVGALIIQADKNLSDRETIETIMETPMLQYFLGLDDYLMEPLFDFSLLSKYRKRLGVDVAKEMIDTLLTHHKVISPVEDEEEITHQGSMSIDATVAPVNITYPTDLKLLNTVREKTEALIDACHKQSGQKVKPRTYRFEARAAYLQYAKAKRLKANKRRIGIRQQLQYIRRNINTIEKNVGQGIYTLDENQQETFARCQIIYTQQFTMWESKTNRIDNRIVSFHQPHIRPIVRNKAGTKVEFGPKLAVSKINGFIHLDVIDFNAFNEGQTLPMLIQKYKDKHGAYPEVIRADKIYQTRANKMYCKNLGIRLSGKPLGRPNQAEQEENERIMREDFAKRQEIEGVFGVAKTRYGLAKLMTKLPESQIASIGLVFFVMNLNQLFWFTPFLEARETLILSIDINHKCLIYDEEQSNIEI